MNITNQNVYIAFFKVMLQSNKLFRILVTLEPIICDRARIKY